MDSPYFFETYHDFSSIQLSEQSTHHATHVLRMRSGDELCITNGKGMLARCKIIDIQKKDCRIEVVETQIHEAPTSKLHMGIAFTKNPARIEWF